MDKKHAFVISLLITFLIFGNYLFFADIYSEKEKVIILRVLDGDTVELEDGRIIRLLNINTPEKGRAFSNESTNFLKNFENKTVELETQGVGKYGRILGRIYSGKYLNLELVKKGLAHKYLVDKNEIKKFKEAEKNARKKEIGIWKKSEYYGCLDIEINKNEEYVRLFNRCESNIQDWTLKDESTKQYDLQIGWEKEVVIYSGSGIDNKKEVFLEKDRIWNNDKDSIFIRDKEGYLVYYESYGY